MQRVENLLDNHFFPFAGGGGGGAGGGTYVFVTGTEVGFITGGGGGVGRPGEPGLDVAIAFLLIVGERYSNKRNKHTHQQPW